MRKFPFRNITLWLTILTLLWSSQGQSYVWCMTEDGPTHLESTQHSHCDCDMTHLPEKTDARVTIFGEEDSSCSPCVDLAATFDTLQQRKLSAGDLASSFLLSTILCPKWTPPLFVRHLLNNLLEAPPRVATSLLVHRTIVLLI